MRAVSRLLGLLSSLVLLWGCGQSPTAADLKVVTSRDWLVTFRVPATWVEKHEREGPSVFQEDRPDAPRLLVTMLAMKSAKPIHTGSPDEVLRSVAVEAKLPDGKNLPIEELPDGNALLRTTESGEDRGKPAVIHGWIVANPLPPRHVRLFFFTFRVLVAEAEEVRIKELVRTLDREIVASNYAERPGK